ncbi:glyoxalase/bleomycin resistance/dioxygenase family protein [Streptomyces sp. SID8376]|uniref:VOC family protein n=1 Tax=Streptomyces TaxID=1883 RepID=UPI00035CF83F|nr:glyoxalase/bleomycin resistance/dioxygenase family protein [Streptomyces sp. SID4956]MYW50905.1 glyoxalase/bleomycin resistance/dioxygenase family protein [Streptomyces sp. SID8376]
MVVGCHDPERLAAFWCAVLDFEVLERAEGKVEIGSWEPAVEAVRARRTPPTVVFIRVPEEKARKNRLHPDVSPVDRNPEAEATRLLSLGPTRVDVGQGPDRTWTAPADPEGTGFCVLRSPAP